MLELEDAPQCVGFLREPEACDELKLYHELTRVNSRIQLEGLSSKFYIQRIGPNSTIVSSDYFGKYVLDDSDGRI